MVKYLRDWAASKERADLVAELEKPRDVPDFYMSEAEFALARRGKSFVSLDSRLEEAVERIVAERLEDALNEARNSTKH